MHLKRVSLGIAVVVLAAFWFVSRPVSADDWQPIDPAELKMTSEPKAPNAPAIFLYRQVDRDDQAFRETQYARIKILTEEGCLTM